jgi:hypothetical protein
MTVGTVRWLKYFFYVIFEVFTIKQATHAPLPCKVDNKVQQTLRPWHFV